MNFIGTKTLETDRLILRKITMNDAESMYNWANDENVIRYLTWQPHENIDVTKSLSGVLY